MSENLSVSQQNNIINSSLNSDKSDIENFELMKNLINKLGGNVGLNYLFVKTLYNNKSIAY